MNSKKTRGDGLGRLRQRKYLLASLSLAGLLVAIVVSLFLPRSYEATTKLRILDNAGLYRQHGRSLEGAPPGAAKGAMIAELRARRTIEDSIAMLRLDRDFLALPDAERAGRMEELIREIQENTTVRVVSEGPACFEVEIVCRHEEPAVAQSLSRQLGRSLQGRHRVLQDAGAMRALRELRERLSATKEEEEKLSAALSAFEAENEEHRLGQADDTRGRLAVETGRLDEVTGAVRALEAQLTDVRQQLDEEPEWLVTGREGGEDGPGERARTKNATYVELRKSELQVLSALTVKQQLEREYRRRVDDLEKRMASYPEVEAAWTEMKARVSTLRTKVEDLTVREEKAEGEWLDRVAQGTMALEIVDAAEYPEKAQQPNRAIFWVGGLLIGLAIGVGAILLLSGFDSSFRSAGEVSSATDVPVLGAVSRIETLGEREAARRKERTALAGVLLLTAVALAGVYVHVTYDAEIGFLVDSALKMVR